MNNTEPGLFLHVAHTVKMTCFSITPPPSHIHFFFIPSDSTHFVSHSRGSIVPFTSQYLAHHVQTTEAGLADLSGRHQSTISNSALPDTVPMTLGQNSTKNLANLSRLFRQFKPHLLQNISTHMKSSQSQLTAQVRIEDNPVIIVGVVIRQFSALFADING